MKTGLGVWRWLGAALVPLFLFAPGVAHAGGVARTSRDPFVRMHVHDGVNWHAWGAQAFALAARENKPIFLSVGFLSCIYCHIEEKEAFQDKQIAAFLNAHFVNIVVDRERRPEVDRIYQIAQRAMQRPVAWPNSIVLTPQRLPFAGGGYYPQHQVSAQHVTFRQMIEHAQHQWQRHPKRVRRRAQAILKKMHALVAAPSNRPQPAPRQWFSQALQYWHERFDARYGGFGHGDSRFPNAPALSMLLSAVKAGGGASQSQRARHELVKTLDAMATGALMDQVKGGFRRYSTDSGWTHPHREKMLYSNALLLDVYARAARQFSDPYYRLVALRTGRFLLRALHARSGGFYTSLTPAMPGGHLARTRLTRSLIVSTLGQARARRFFRVYRFVPISNPTGEELLDNAVPGFLRVRTKGLITHGRLASAKLVRRLHKQAGAIKTLRRKLEAHGRHNVVKTKIAATNGLAIAALAHAGAALQQKSWVAAARKAGGWLWATLYQSDSGASALHHQAAMGADQGPATLQDYADAGLAFLALHEATQRPVWLQHARVLARRLRRRFQQRDGLLVSVADPKYLILPPVDLRDGQTPSGTSAAVRLFLKLYQHGHHKPDLVAARRAVRAAARRVAEAPGHWPALLTALRGSRLAAR